MADYYSAISGGLTYFTSGMVVFGSSTPHSGLIAGVDYWQNNIPRSNASTIINKEQNITKMTLETEDEEVREFRKGEGLFRKGIKKFKKVPPYEKQVEMINEEKKVKSYDPETKTVVIDTGRAGKYKVKLNERPMGWLIEHEFLGKQKLSKNAKYLYTEGICLGSAHEMYQKAWNNKDYFSCVRIVTKILSGGGKDK